MEVQESKVYFIDVTNRDGVQASRMQLAKLQKTMVNYHLGQLGIYQSEFGFPALWHEQNYIEANLRLAEQGVMGNLVLSGWCRATVGDVEEATRRTRVRHFNLSIPTSEQMIKGKLRGKFTPEDIIHSMVDAVHAASEAGGLTIGVNAEDAVRSDLDYLIRFAQAAKEAGAHRLRYCDTIGGESPSRIYQRIYQLAQAVGIPIELHCHNDLGLAVANSLSGAQAALEAGVDAYINASINGLGERAGQADLLSCILACKFGFGVAEGLEIGDNLHLEFARRLANYVANAFNVPLSINQPGVGANVFAHESGIHADGVLKDHRNYELYDYDLLGPPETPLLPPGRVITTGEYGGLSGLHYVYERLGIYFNSQEEALDILRLVQVANAHTHMPLTNDELRFIANHPEEVRLILTLNLEPRAAESHG